MNVNKININQSEPTYYIESGAYDVSAHNNGVTFESLQSLLSSDNLSTLIPSEVRCGGMSIRFIQSSDNKYVQFRYMSSSTAVVDFTNVANWQEVDVNSAIANTGLYTTVDDSNIETGYFINQNGVKRANPDYGIISVSCKKNDIVIVTTPSSSSYVSVIAKIVGKENIPMVVADSNASKEYSYTVEDDTIILLSIKLNQYKAEIFYNAKTSIIDLDKLVNGELLNVDFSSLISGSFISETGEVRPNDDYGILTVNVLKDDEIHFTAASSSGYVSVISEGSATPYLSLVIADTNTTKEYIYKADYNKVLTLCVRKSGNYYATIRRPSKTLPLETDVILFIGQSNMAGRGVVNSTHTEDAPSVVTGTGYEFKAIKDPTKLYPITKLFGKGENTVNGINDGNDKTGGMVPSFVNSYYSITKTPIIGVSASQGGTMSSDWLPTGTLLPDSIQRFQDCLTFCTQKSIVTKNKYAIWCQGESDGDHSVTAETYKNNFASICSALFNAGIEKIFVCRIGEYNGSNTPDYTVIINAQTDICKTTKDIVMATTTLASFKARRMMKDDWHYYQDAYNEMGRYSGVNVGTYQVTNKEQTMYDPKSDNLYYSHKN